MSLDSNKEVVRRFNQEVIQEGNRSTFEELMAKDFVNHSAPEGTPNGPESMWNTFQSILRPALAQLQVEIYSQVAEGDLVTTRKKISGIHEGALFGIEPTHRKVGIDVIDVVRIANGRYVEHWGINTLSQVLASLRQPQ